MQAHDDEWLTARPTLRSTHASHREREHNVGPKASLVLGSRDLDKLRSEPDQNDEPFNAGSNCSDRTNPPLC
jgi:hypothetical protein